MQTTNFWELRSTEPELFAASSAVALDYCKPWGQLTRQRLSAMLPVFKYLGMRSVRLHKAHDGRWGFSYDDRKDPEVTAFLGACKGVHKTLEAKNVEWSIEEAASVIRTYRKA